MISPNRLDQSIIKLESQNVAGWLSYAEINFIKVLDQVVDNQALIFTKVHAIDLIRDQDMFGLDEYCEEFEKSIDFVLCDKKTLRILCVIELDDRPHGIRERESECSYRSICTLLNIPLIEIPAQCGYELEILRQHIFPHLDYRVLI